MINITKIEFVRLAEYIETNYGIHLKDEKRTMITSKLYNELISSNCQNFTEYYEYIISDKSGKALTTLINKITTNHTFFMRESAHFYYFRDKVLPYLTLAVKNKDLRIWSAGCSTGQEPYTLAMIIHDYLKTEKMFWDTKILATDISRRVLDEATKGIYSKDEIGSLPLIWKLNYFQKLDDGNFKIHDTIKHEVIYRYFNLMDKFPFKQKFHIIFCRNVMIYFDDKTKMDLIHKFYDVLENGGYLFIGHTESIPRNETGFQYIMPAVYRKL